MPTLNKLEYLDETKKEIKNALNTNFNSGITDEDTFRSYVGKINNIYTNWTKVTGEGTEITLNNTKKGKMALTPKGNTEQNGTPTPDSPVPIQNVTGLQEIKLQNKNLFDGELEIGGLGGSGEETISSTNCRSKNYIEINSNETYTLSADTNENIALRFYDENKNFISSGTSAGSPNTFTTPNNAEYLRFMLVNNTDLSTQCQLEKGLNSTTPITHQEQNFELNLGNIELCKIGTYQDYIYKSNGNWYLHQEIGKVVLDGSENITNPSNTGYSNTILRFNITVADKKYGKSGTIVDDILSNNFTCEKLDYDARTSESVAGHAAEHIVIIFIDKSRLSTENVQGFKTWLSTHNTMVYYVLATPTNTEITDTTLIEQLNSLSNATSYDDVTNISTEGNLAVVISVSALMKGGN